MPRPPIPETREEIFARRSRQLPRLPRILTEGDSWFDLPFPGRNIVDQLLSHYPDNACWLRLERVGEEATQMFLPQAGKGISQVDHLRRMLQKYTFHLLLISAGGNDAIGADGKFFGSLLRNAGTNNAADYLDTKKLDGKLDEVMDAYDVLLRLRDEHQQGRPVVAHVYDYAIPQNRPVRLVFPIKGPWLWPHLQTRGVTAPKLQRQIVRVLIDRFADRLFALEDRPGSNFHVVDTRNKVRDDEWGDEIHPSGDGFHRVAGEFVPWLRGFCPGSFGTAWPARVD